MLASLAVVIGLAAFFPAQANAQARASINDHRSKNFLIHTDLPTEDAEELLERLETMLKLVSRYWGQPNRKIIECYVVKDLKNWPSGRLNPTGEIMIRNGGGVTLSRSQILGNRHKTEAIVYATASRGTPQHEAVHAFSMQTFGRTGPVWYSEGMAEMGNHWIEGDTSVTAPPYVVRYLSQSPPKSLLDIVDLDAQTGDSWQNYAWRWALCHLLANNTNYRERFRPMGLALLTNKRGVSFQSTYGAMAKEVSFEYLFFLKHLARGYEVELCSWDWKTRFRKPRGRSTASSKIKADHGWQASRVLVDADADYHLETKGEWKLSEDGDDLTADGQADGRGILLGVIFRDYKLGEPFEIGSGGVFTAPSTGRLFLRCRDDWNSLKDNSGEMAVTIRSESAKDEK